MLYWLSKRDGSSGAHKNAILVGTKQASKQNEVARLHREADSLAEEHPAWHSWPAGLAADRASTSSQDLDVNSIGRNLLVRQFVVSAKERDHLSTSC